MYISTIKVYVLLLCLILIKVYLFLLKFLLPPPGRPRTIFDFVFPFNLKL